MLLSLLILFSQSVFFVKNLINTPSVETTQEKQPTPIKINPLRAKNYQIDATTQNIEKQLESNLKQLQLQPTHRDILINTALLYQQQQQLEAEKYYYQAFALDPNSFLFQKN